MSEKIQGRCPACGLETLFVGSGGYLTCSSSDCPNPSALSDLILQRTDRHYVEISADGHKYVVVHPLIERLQDDRTACIVSDRVSAILRQSPPVIAGRYRVELPGYEADLKWIISPKEID